MVGMPTFTPRDRPLDDMAPEAAVAVRRRVGHLGQFVPVHPGGRRAHNARGGRVGRTALGAAFLVPLAARRRPFRGLRQVIVPIAFMTRPDMAAPTCLTASGGSLGPAAAGLPGRYCPRAASWPGHARDRQHCQYGRYYLPAARVSLSMTN